MALLRDVGVFQTSAARVDERRQSILLQEQAEPDYLFCFLVFLMTVIVYTLTADLGGSVDGCTSRSDHGLWCGDDIFPDTSPDGMTGESHALGSEHDTQNAKRRCSAWKPPLTGT